MNISLSKRLMAGVFLVGCPIVLGCSPGSATSRVSGTVTMDGEPLAGVQVTFYPVGGEGRPAIGNTDEGGSFRLSTFEPGDGAAPGEYEVAITSAVPPPMPGTPPEMLASSDPSAGVFVNVPGRYARWPSRMSS